MSQVLIVDPSQEDRSTLSDLISPHCDGVRSARTSDEAIGILNGKTVDVVVTEIFLDHMDGLEFIRKVKDRFPGTKVISITSGPKVYKHEAAGNISYFLRAAHVAGADFAIKKEQMAGCLGCIASSGYFQVSAGEAADA